jgi:hypothetical protein
MSNTGADTLQASEIVNYQHADIQNLIAARGWRALSPYDRIGAAYDFVRNEIRFGYNLSDDRPASEVLRDGYGQCNTKGNLLVALLRALDIPCRFHGFTIYNELQKGAIPTYLFWLAPKRILHSWVEVEWQGEWLNLEGFILDDDYLHAVQKAHTEKGDVFSGYGIATSCLRAPPVEWKGESTYIQREGIADDFGLFTSPDDFYRERGTNLKGPRRYIYRYLVRHLINWHVARIRAGR